MNIFYSPLGLIKTNGYDRKQVRKKIGDKVQMVKCKACWEMISNGVDVRTCFYKEDVYMSQLPLSLSNHS